MIHHDLFNTIPAVTAQRGAAKVSKAAEKAIRSRHPWVYDRAITSLTHAKKPGDLVIIFDSKRNFLAIGLYDPDSPIRIKVIHVGKPTQIDRAFWQGKLTAALQIRHPLTDTETTGYRIIHGENDRLPGLIVDRYADVCVIKLYSAIWLPYLRDWVAILAEIVEPRTIVLRLGRRLQAQETFGLTDGQTVYGDPPDGAIMFLENGLQFEADVVQGQKTGHFLDQRDNRARIRDLAEGKTVLDLFACTGGFSVYAAAGGATSVLSLDRSQYALDQAIRNMAHNHNEPNVAQCQHAILCADAFDALKQLAHEKQTFDIVIIDPPSFAQKQADVEQALNAYAKLAKLSVAVTKKGGTLLLASCSSRVSADIFFDTIDHAIGYSLREEIRTGHAIDHPITFPEGAYLKCLFATRL